MHYSGRVAASCRTMAVLCSDEERSRPVRHRSRKCSPRTIAFQSVRQVRCDRVVAPLAGDVERGGTGVARTVDRGPKLEEQLDLR